MEQKKTLQNLVRAIKKVENEIELINNDISQSSGRMASSTTNLPTKNAFTPSSQIGTLQEWFSLYGKPSSSEEERNDKITSFLPSSKVYGGTTYHSAFRSQSTVMKKGRITL